MAYASDVNITLTADEALVLFELLHRSEDSGHVSAPEHQGEQVALWSLSALLERELPESFDAQYGDLVEMARKRPTHTEE